jgi:hypothetical protein
MRRTLHFLLITALLTGGVLASNTNWGAILIGSSAPSEPPGGGSGLPPRKSP